MDVQDISRWQDLAIQYASDVGLFVSAINTPDNVLTLVGNSKIFSDTIQNFSTNAFRRVDLKAQLSGAADHAAAQALFVSEQP
jgi:small conductance mechanosensitive channel